MQLASCRSCSARRVSIGRLQSASIFTGQSYGPNAESNHTNNAQQMRAFVLQSVQRWQCGHEVGSNASVQSIKKQCPRAAAARHAAEWEDDTGMTKRSRYRSYSTQHEQETGEEVVLESGGLQPGGTRAWHAAVLSLRCWIVQQVQQQMQVVAELPPAGRQRSTAVVQWGGKFEGWFGVRASRQRFLGSLAGWLLGRQVWAPTSKPSDVGDFAGLAHRHPSAVAALVQHDWPLLQRDARCRPQRKGEFGG